MGQIDASCTATLIDPRWIVTAAHCPNGSKFRLGGSEFDISRCVRHPDFVSSGRVYDFMVCELATSSNAPRVPLMTSCEAEQLRGDDEPRALPLGRPVVVVGLGAPASGTKRALDMQVSSFMYSSPLISFDDPMELGGAMPGDSGGPTFVAMDDGTWRQVGVHHEGAAGTFVLDVMLPVAREWIETTTGIDATPCHDGETWAPSAECVALPSSLEQVSGTFPACNVARTVPTPTCRPDLAADAQAPDDASVPVADAERDDPRNDGGAPPHDVDAAQDAMRASQSDSASDAAQAGGCGCTLASDSMPAAYAAPWIFALLLRSRRDPRQLRTLRRRRLRR